MATIYLSSTFSDLQECRQRVYRALARLKHTVRAMEDYVARDDRPVEACLKDVADCDLYVGLFAHRYGYIVDDAARNPDKLSITELELRKAQEMGKKCLIFLLDPKVPWSPEFMDSFKGDGEAGARILKLRADLEKRYTPRRVQGPGRCRRAGRGIGHQRARDDGRTGGQPDPRQIAADVLLVHSPLDEAGAQALCTALRKVSLRVTVSPRLLFSADAGAIEELDQAARSHQTVVGYFSAAAVGQLAGQAQATSRALALLEARSGCLVAVTAARASLPADWTVTSTHPLAAATPTIEETAAIVADLERAAPRCALGQSSVCRLSSWP